MARIFISYSRADETFARHLAGALSGMGADVWIDIEDIPAGMKWSSAIQEGLDSGDLLIVILSPDSMSSRNVEDEWQYYLDHKKPVVPVLLHPAKVHFQLNRLQYIDFDRQSFDIAINQLYAELRRNGLQLSAPTRPADSRNLPNFDNLTPEEIDRVLEELQKRRSEFGQGAAVPYPAPRPARSSSRLWLVGGVVGIAIVLLVVLLVMQSGGTLQATQTPPPASPTDDAQATQLAQAAQATSTATDSPAAATDTATPTELPPTPTAQVPVATFNTGVNIRRGPDLRFSPPFGSFAAGDTANLLAVNPDRTWYKVQHPDGEGWFLASLADVTGDVDHLLVDPGPPLPPGLTADNPITHNTDWTPVTRPLNGFDMALVPTGSFQMGTSPADLHALYQECQLYVGSCQGENLFGDENPVITVTFDQPFWIDRYEVSNGQYGSSGTYSGSDLPRTNVTAREAAAFCEARGARLPTEREWEYASRGPDALTYPWGQTFSSPILNYCDATCEYGWRDPVHSDNYRTPAPVSSFAENASWVGAINMAGNVWEWTSTIYAARPGDGYEDPGNVDALRTLKGSSWNWIYPEARGAARAAPIQPSSDWYGFRCARDFQPGDLG